MTGEWDEGMPRDGLKRRESPREGVGAAGGTGAPSSFSGTNFV